MDRLFDILNSRSPKGKGYKRPISQYNLTEIETFIKDSEAFLLGISMPDGQPLLSTKRYPLKASWVHVFKAVVF